MKVIDLLNKIANGEKIPKKIKYKNIEYEYEDIGYYNKQRGYLFDGYYVDGILNDEVEILDEEDKIEKLSYQQIGSWALEQHNWVDYARAVDKQIQQIGSKINQLIDEVNKLKENK